MSINKHGRVNQTYCKFLLILINDRFLSHFYCVMNLIKYNNFYRKYSLNFCVQIIHKLELISLIGTYNRRSM